VRAASHFATLGAVVALVAGGVWVSAEFDRRPLATEAIAAAIAEENAWYSEAEAKLALQQGRKPEIVPLCLDAEPLDYALLAERLTNSFLRPLPVSRCVSKSADPDPAALSAVTGWTDENGAFAVMMSIRSVRCMTRSQCSVDIAFLGAGQRYEVQRTASGWIVKSFTIHAVM